MGIGAIGPAAGVGYTGGKACEAIMRQPAASGPVLRMMLIGEAVTESAGIFALVVAILLLFTDAPGEGWVAASALLGSGLCIGFGCIGPGFGAGLSSGSACEGLGRQPRSSGALMLNMLIGQAIAQTPAIFALVVSFLLMFLRFGEDSLIKIFAVLGAGLSTGLGSIGPGLGSGFVAGKAADGIGRRTINAAVVTRTMLLGQAVTQSTSIYSMVVSFLLMFVVIGS
jgi:ATP synthase F0 subunit c